MTSPSWTIIGWLITTGIAVTALYYSRKALSINYAKPKLKIIKSSATPPPFSSSVVLTISNPSNFENTICSFKLYNLKSFQLARLVTEKEVDIKLPATSIVDADIPIDFESVKRLRGQRAILCLTDLKGSRIKKKFVFMPSYNQKQSV